MSNSDGTQTLDSIVRNQADGQCEECGTEDTDRLDVYNTGDTDTVSLDTLVYLCRSCYHETYSDTKIPAGAVLDFFDAQSLPFITSSMVAEEFDCRTETGRQKLNELVTQDRLERYELDARRTLYFQPDYRAVNDVIDGLQQHIDLGDLDPERVEAFAKQPFKILPRNENEYYVLVPRFLNFSVGHLHNQDDAWRTYIINQYVTWFSDLPDQITDEITLPQRYDDAKVDGNVLELASEDERERAWDDFDGQDGPLAQREDDTKIRIQQGKEFEVVATLIDSGNLPFTPSPIAAEDIRSAPPEVSLRDYQQEAWETFEEYGSVGVYWPMGVGKTWWALYAGARINGTKLVVVPSSTLEQQWEQNIDERAPHPDDWDVRTYQYLTHSNGTNLEEYQGEDAPTLTIFDECHYIPADTFSQLAMIETDYRIGLSASPYREDDRTEYIFALTGMPIGMDWEELVQYGVVEYPDVHVYSYRTQRQKRQDLYQLVEQRPGNGLVFCDSRDDGDTVSEKLDVPFVNGDTPSDDRMDIINDNPVTVVSRVGDEGMSIPDLDWSIEHQFLGKSRRQAMQRTGRLMHGNDDTGTDPSTEDGDLAVESSSGVHIVQMTDDEIEKYGERLYSLQEKGFNIQFERRA